MYSVDRRQLATHVYSLLQSLRKAAIVLNVSHSTVSRWLKSPFRKPYQKRAAKKENQIVEIIVATIASDPFITTRKFVEVIENSLHLKVSKELVRIVIKRLGQTRKKAKFFAKPPTLLEKTDIFLTRRNQFIASGRYIVSMDETGFGRSGKQMYGYAPKGRQLILSKRPPNSKNTSVLAVVSADGLLARESRLGSFKKETFAGFLRTLELPPETVILLDNASIHHAQVVKDTAISKGWTLLFTPPYSPWFNPIEEAFSIVKRHYYKYQDIVSAFGALMPSHCNAFFRHSFSKN